MLCGRVFKPGYSFLFLSVVWWLGTCESTGFLEIRIEPVQKVAKPGFLVIRQVARFFQAVCCLEDTGFVHRNTMNFADDEPDVHKRAEPLHLPLAQFLQR